MWTGRSTCRCISSSAASTYHDVAGASFKDLLAGKLAQFPGERATQSDWANHVSTIFPEVRLKRYLEMRGADVGGPDHIAALSAFWTGILYDPVALDGAWDLVKRLERGGSQRRAGGDVPRRALNATVGGRSVRDVARDALDLSRAGLKRRGIHRRIRPGRNALPRLRAGHRRDPGRTAAEDLLEQLSRPLGRLRAPSLQGVRVLASAIQTGVSYAAFETATRFRPSSFAS